MNTLLLVDLDRETNFDKFQKKDIECIVWYRACQYRWEETNDPIKEDINIFKTFEEALDYAEKINLEIGFYAQIEKIKYETSQLDEEEEVEELSLNHSGIDIDIVWTSDTFEGNNITDAIIIEWNYEKYVGYARNLIKIGIAGQDFHRFNVESDLISGNENSIFRSNYSVLLTAEEIKDLDKDELRELIETELNSSYWKWNSFKNNPNSRHIQDSINKICGQDESLVII